MHRLGKSLILLENDADVLALWVTGGVAIVTDVARCSSMNRMITTLVRTSSARPYRYDLAVITYHRAMVPREPMRSSLLEQDISRHYILSCSLLGA